MLKDNRTVRIFPEKLVAERNRLGLTQEAFCNKSGFNIDTLRKLEAGRTKPYRSTLKKLAEGFGVSTEELLARIGNGNRMEWAELRQMIFDTAHHEGTTEEEVLRLVTEFLNPVASIRLIQAVFRAAKTRRQHESEIMEMLANLIDPLREKGIEITAAEVRLAAARKKKKGLGE